MSQPDDLGGIFDVINSDADHSYQPEAVEAPESTPEPENKQETDVEETQEASTSSDEGQRDEQTEEVQDENQSTNNQKETDSQESEPSQETQEEQSSETEAEVDWKAQLPPPPPEYNGPRPEIDPETGQLTNMTAEEFARYNVEIAKAEMRRESYTANVENAALDAAEKVLPEIKTNPAVRALVENARLASVLNGQQIDSYEAAKQVRDALQLGPAAMQKAREQGAANAKASITIQKNAALETGSTQKAPEGDKVGDLQKRIRRGDDEAFVELLGMWEDNGVIQ